MCRGEEFFMSTYSKALVVSHISLVGCRGKSDLYRSFKDSNDSLKQCSGAAHLAAMEGSMWHMKVADVKIVVTSDFILGHEAIIQFDGPEERGFGRGTINFGFNQSVLAISCHADDGKLWEGFWTKLYTTQKANPKWLAGSPMEYWEFR
jgi:hypothetical protein